MLNIILFLFLSPVVNAKKEYRLFNKMENSDFNYNALRYIDTFSSRRKVFQPIQGAFSVYTFIATYKGLSHRDELLHDFHDILIIKTDKNNVIQDAFQYTLEWAEIPLSYDLHKSMTSGVILSNDLSVEKLNLQSVRRLEKIDPKTKEGGVIKLH